VQTAAKGGDREALSVASRRRRVELEPVDPAYRFGKGVDVVKRRQQARLPLHHGLQPAAWASTALMPNSSLLGTITARACG